MKKSIALRLAAIPAVLAVSAGSAMAALPAEVTTALADMKSDGAIIAGAFLVAIIAFAVFKIMRKGA